MAIFKNRPLACALVFFLLCIVLCCAFLSFAVALVVAVSAAFLFIVLVALMVGQGYSYSRLCLTLISLGILLGAARSAHHLYQTAALTSKIGEKVTVLFEVEEVEYTNTYSSQLTVKVKEINGTPCRGRALILADFSSPFYRGDVASGTVAVKDLTYDNYYKNQHYQHRAKGCSVIFLLETTEGLLLQEHRSSKIIDAIEALRFRLSDRLTFSVEGEVGSLLSAMLLGERDDISPTTTRNFRRAGVSHLLAISGLHIGILAAILERILYLLGAHKKSRIALTLLFMFGYLILTGATPSTLRAVFMLSLVLLGFFFKSRADALSSLLVAASVILLWQPYAFYSTSYQLTILATFGILSFEEVECALLSLLPKRKGIVGVHLAILRFVMTSLLISLFAGFAILPIQWLTFGEIALLTPLSNLVMIPLAAPFLLFGILLLVCDWCLPIAFLCRGIGTLILDLAQRFSTPDAVLSLSYDFAPYVIIPCVIAAIVLLLLPLGRRRWLTLTPIASLVVLFALCLTLTRANGEGELTALYRMSGKNESIGLIGNEGAVLVDLSSGSSTQLSEGWRLLQDAGATELVVMVFTHYHKAQVVSFSRFSERNVVHALWLPEPRNEAELAIFESLFSLASEENVSVVLYPYGGEVKIFETGTMLIGEPIFMSRSTEPALFLSVSYGDSLLYYESTALSEYRSLTKKEAPPVNADLYILGAHGPVPHKAVVPVEGDHGTLLIPNEQALVLFEVLEGCEYFVYLEKYRFLLQ
ncbi:MAG: ComEC/Rec2 family competence protein [Clostridia bacterium]|nr:ComEC/Rec2 family competence protein [Clostridia bacterium]